MRRAAAILVGSIVIAAAPSFAFADPPKEPVAVLADLAPTTPSPRTGVVVIAVADGTREATWPVAQAVYGAEAIRPTIEDRDAKVLAGAAPAADAPTSTKDLAELRAKVKGNDAASRAILADIARRTRARAIVVVFAPHDQTPTEAQVYDAADDRLDASLLRADHHDDGDSWAPVVELLRGRYGKTSAASASSAVATKPTPEPEKKKESSSILSSPWFWGALAGAAAGALAVYLYSHESSSTGPAPVHLDWSH